MHICVLTTEAVAAARLLNLKVPCQRYSQACLFATRLRNRSDVPGGYAHHRYVGESDRIDIGREFPGLAPTDRYCRQNEINDCRHFIRVAGHQLHVRCRWHLSFRFGQQAAYAPGIGGLGTVDITLGL